MSSLCQTLPLEMWNIIRAALDDVDDAQSLAWTCRDQWKARNRKLAVLPMTAPRPLKDVDGYNYVSSHGPLTPYQSVGTEVIFAASYNSVLPELWVGYIFKTGNGSVVVRVTHYLERSDRPAIFHPADRHEIKHIKSLRVIHPAHCARMRREIAEVRARDEEIGQPPKKKPRAEARGRRRQREEEEDVNLDDLLLTPLAPPQQEGEQPAQRRRIAGADDPM